MSKWSDIYDNVLADIRDHNGAPGSRYKIAARLGIKDSHVSIAIRMLKDGGMLAVDQQGDFRKANTYLVFEQQAESDEPDEDEIDRLTLEGEL